ncbi:MAG: alpha/beta hydrolase fold domain-containing protein [Sedimentisphaerales bacterium]|nr:alpha/beta hydrolase fold domain-containing protein [Sedimentisphaerales bacterium]
MHTMVLITALTLLSAFSQMVAGQMPSQSPAADSRLTISIWSDIAPGSGGRPQDDDASVQPTMTAYLPDESKSNGTAVIVCPGGAFRALSNEESVALWLNQQGIAAFVLRYHLLDPRSGGRGGMGQIPRNLEIKNANANPEPNNKELAKVVRLATADGRQAINIVRQNAEKWKINPKRIGIIGFSAGGGVAVGSVLESRPENRPDFVATLYGPALVDVNVPADAPHLFIAVAADHMPVSAGCVALYNVWKAAGKSAELHVYSDGRAGFSMRKQGLTSDLWYEQLYSWMKVRGFCD